MGRRSQLNDSWTRVRNQIESMWGDVNFDEAEMKRARGSLSHMINLIEQKTGETPAEIRRKVMTIV